MQAFGFAEFAIKESIGFILKWNLQIFKNLEKLRQDGKIRRHVKWAKKQKLLELRRFA